MLVSFALGDANFSLPFQTQYSCVGHVHFILFVSISFALGSQRKQFFSGIWALTYSGLLFLDWTNIYKMANTHMEENSQNHKFSIK